MEFPGSRLSLVWKHIPPHGGGFRRCLRKREDGSRPGDASLSAVRVRGRSDGLLLPLCGYALVIAAVVRWVFVTARLVMLRTPFG